MTPGHVPCLSFPYFQKFSSFAIGVGDELNFPVLEQLATSNDHLIHTQDPEKVAKQIGSKLCVNSGVVYSSPEEKEFRLLKGIEGDGNGVRRKEAERDFAFGSVIADLPTIGKAASFSYKSMCFQTPQSGWACIEILSERWSGITKQSTLTTIEKS